MTNGTKIFLALFALIVGTLVVYYGVIMPDNAAGTGKDQSQTAESGLPANEGQVAHGAQPAAQPERRLSPPPRNPAPTVPQAVSPPNPDAASTGGLLSQGIREAGGGGGGEAGEGASLSVIPGATSPTPPVRPFIPLIALNDGDLRSSSTDAPKGDVSTDPQPMPVQSQDQSPPIESPQETVPQPQPEPQPEPQPQRSPDARVEHSIKAGETFSSIAKDWFGDSSKWSLIAKANPTVDPQKLKIGQVIQLPPKASAEQPATPEPVPAQGETIYTIQSGDSLIAISRWHFGVDDRWEEIYALNRDVIGANPAALKVGMKLKLPRK